MIKQTSSGHMVPHLMTAYNNSEVMKKSNNGFDQRAYKGFAECWDTYVMPLLAELNDNYLPSQEREKLLRHNTEMKRIINSILDTKSLVLTTQQLRSMDGVINGKGWI